jgi:uncharacterized phage-associated protein
LDISFLVELSWHSKDGLPSADLYSDAAVGTRLFTLKPLKTVMTTSKPQAIANAFLEKAKNEGRALTPLQIQKLVFLAHGWSLSLRGVELIDEPIQAWTYGPVIRSLYDDFKFFGSDPILQMAPVYEGGRFSTPVERSPEIAPLLNFVWERYKDLTAGQLSRLTHLEGSPWKQVGKNEFIPNWTIKQYYDEQKSLGNECKV